VEASSDLRFDRSLLTGERCVDYFIFFSFLYSHLRNSDMVPGSTISTSNNPMETRNLALTSTFVVQGKCTGVVFATGDRTIMGRIVAMSGDTKFKLTTVQKEVWFFTKIISALALSLFCIAIIVWAAWLRKSFPGFETASGAIINSIGCLTAFVPQVIYLLSSAKYPAQTVHSAGFTSVCCALVDYCRSPNGCPSSPCQEPGDYRNVRMHVSFMLR
jgi:sodium/potassium-transporting ATPase subunit alpha